MIVRARQHLHPTRTAWHITVGTYGTRLHGDGPNRPTVDKKHNQFGTPFLAPDPARARRESIRMKYPAVRLAREQCLLIQDIAIPECCTRGGWQLRVCSASEDHFHVLLDILPHIHGEKVRRLLKRWLTQTLNEKWPPGSGRPGSRQALGAAWWVEEGSNKAIHDEDYLTNAHWYIFDQRSK